MTPKDLRYADSHEWAKLEGDVCTIGITQFAVEQLTEVVFVELAKVGKSFKAKDVFGQIESVKSVNDLYAPVGGEIIAKNESAEKDPALVSKDPYGAGWMIKIKIAAKTDYDKLMSAEQYEQQIASGGH